MEDFVDVVDGVENAGEAVAENAINEVSSSIPDLVPVTTADIKNIVYGSEVKAGAAGAVTVVGLGILGYGVYKGVKWIVKKVKAKKEEQTDAEVVND